MRINLIEEWSRRGSVSGSFINDEFHRQMSQIPEEMEKTDMIWANKRSSRVCNQFFYSTTSFLLVPRDKETFFCNLKM